MAIQPVGENKELRARAASSSGSHGGLHLAMSEGVRGAAEELRCVEQAGMGALIDQGVGEFAGQRLSDDEVGDVTTGDEHG